MKLFIFLALLVTFLIYMATRFFKVAKDNRCPICGEVMEEGRTVCPACEFDPVN